MRFFVSTWATVGLATAMAAGCGVGEGAGQVSGALFFNDCAGVGKPYRDRVDNHPGTPDNPAAYDMRPSFFAGEPIEDLEGKTNRLIVRLQSNGKRIEVTDSLVFDVRDAYEVARCVRGRMNGTEGDWDAAICHRYDDGGVTRARVRVGTDQPVRANLTLQNTCKGAQIIAVGTSSVAAGPDWESYVELSVFGAASVAAQDTAPLDRDFKVNWGESITASGFKVSLDDERVVVARIQGVPLPQPEVGGVLTGNFDFVLRRGQAAQAFP